MPGALIIFINNHLQGAVKTKLANSIGEKEAMAIYRQLLVHTYNITSKSKFEIYLFYSDTIKYDDYWTVSVKCHKYLQNGNNQAERMLNAFELVFAQGYNKVIFIGSDCIELESRHIKQAFNYLDDTDIVIGPAQDGGYYLLGMRRLFAHLFTSNAWNTVPVFNEKLIAIEAQGLSFSLLDVLSDVDDQKEMYLLHHRQ
jgi:uncharacterized protein